MLLNPKNINGWIVVRCYHHNSLGMTQDFVSHNSKYGYGFVGSQWFKAMQYVKVFKTFEEAKMVSEEYGKTDVDAEMMIHPTHMKPQN